ncbi:MAG: hypothetical protein MJZ61_08145 [Bacteroidales bacterium]|nr:hypothetical protein [Bacteroidales bacterium]
MKIRNILTALAITASMAGTANAQYTITKESYKIDVMNFPANYIKPDDRNYVINIENKVDSILTNGYITGDLDLSGWREETGDSAYLAIKINIQPIVDRGVDFKDVITEKKIPDGIDIIHHYTPTIKYVFNIKATFKTPTETFERTSTLEGGSTMKTHTIKIEFPTKEAALKYIKENRKDIYTKIAEEGFSTIVKEIQTAINEKYIASAIQEEITLAYLLDAENPFEEAMKEAHQYVPQELGMIKADSGIKNAEAGMNVWIEKFQYAAGELSMTVPAQKKAKEEMIKNLVVIYYTLEDFDSCVKYAQILKDTFKSKDGDRYIKMVNNIRNEMEKHHQTSRHFRN